MIKMKLRKCRVCNIEGEDDIFQKQYGKPQNRCKKCYNKYLSEYKLKTGKTSYSGQKPQKYNLLNMKFGMLTVVEFIYHKEHSKWKCICSCGKYTITRQSRLLNKKVKSCGCYTGKNIGESHHSWNGYKCISGSILLRLKNGALKRNIEFNITAKYIYELFISQDKKCKISGIDLIIFDKVNDFKTGKNTASLDRIDSSKGYIEGNLQWIHKDINRMKNKYSYEYFLDMCKKITDYNK